MAASKFHVVVMLLLPFPLLLSYVRAQSSSSSSSLGAEISVVNITDICGQDEYNNDCWYPVTCKTCLSRANCAVDVLTGRCVSSSIADTSESSSSSFSSAPYFLSGETTYCSAIDPACFACRRGDAPAVCLGSTNCVCVSQCEQISSRPTKCLPSSVGGMGSGSLVAAAAVILPLVSYMIFKGSPCSASCSVRRMLQRRRRDKTRRNLPAGLKLDAWRNHLKDRSDLDEQFADLELRSCFIPMESGRTQPRHNDGAETGERVHVEDADDSEVSQAVVATDLQFSATADRRAAAEGREERTGAELHVV